MKGADKRTALETVVPKRAASATEDNGSYQCSESPVITHVVEADCPQKPPPPDLLEEHLALCISRKPLKHFGPSGGTRTSNPSLNNRMFAILRMHFAPH